MTPESRADTAFTSNKRNERQDFISGVSCGKMSVCFSAIISHFLCQMSTALRLSFGCTHPL